MARRMLSERLVTNVTPDLSQANALNSLATVGQIFQKFKQKKDEAKINDFLVDSQIQMLEATKQWRVDNEGDPTNKEATFALDKQYNDILGQYTSQIGALSRDQWVGVSRKLKDQFKLQNATWGMKQEVTNANTRINGSIKKNLNLASEYGINNDIDGALANFSASVKALELFGDGVLGEETLRELLKDYKSDYMKSFITGMAGENPGRAMDLLSDESVINDIDDIEAMKDLKKIILKAQKEQEIGSELQQFEAQRAFNESMGEMNLAQQLATLDQGINLGTFDKKWAESKRATLLSDKGIDATTQKDYEYDIIQSIADITATYGVNKEKQENARDYLRGIRNVEIKINNGLAHGKLNRSVTNKLLKSLHNKTTAEATQNAIDNASWGFRLNDARDLFKKTLKGFIGTDNQGEALREFFYRTDGKDLDDKKKKEIAIDIADEIRTKTRQEVFNEYDKKIEGTLDEQAKALGTTMEKVRDTAKIYKMTEQEVIDKLRE